jgi:hypothetical protein
MKALLSVWTGHTSEYSGKSLPNLTDSCRLGQAEQSKAILCPSHAAILILPASSQTADCQKATNILYLFNKRRVLWLNH